MFDKLFVILFLMLIVFNVVFAFILNWANFYFLVLSFLIFIGIYLKLSFSLLTFIAKKPDITPRSCIFLYVLFYLLFLFTFAMYYKEACLLGHQLYDLNNECVSSFPYFLYFSTVTVTTLGYGDIKPAYPLTYALSAIEVSLGVIFLTVILSTGLSFRIPFRDSGSQNEESTHSDETILRGYDFFS